MPGLPQRSPLVALCSGTARPRAEGTRGTKGAPGVPRTRRVSPGAKLHGLSLACQCPSLPYGARGGPGLTGAREDGGRDGRTDGESGGRKRPGGRRRRCRGPATSQCGRAAGAAPRAPQRTRAGGDTRGGGTLSSGTRPPGRTDSDRPLVPQPSPRPSAVVVFPGVPGQRTCCFCLPRAFTSAALALPRRLSPFLPPS